MHNSFTKSDIKGSFEISVDPDQLASDEAIRSGTTLSHPGPHSEFIYNNSLHAG